MKKLKSLADILSSSNEDEELYVSEKSKRKWRANKGLYSKQAHLFDFIHLVNRWELIVGKMLSQNTIPIKIKRSVLYVLTKHSVFSHELSLMSPLIIQKIEDNFPYFKGQIKKINYSSGNYSSEEFNKLKNEREGANKEAPKKDAPHPFDPKFRARKSQVQKMFEDVEDEQIKELLIKITLDN